MRFIAFVAGHSQELMLVDDHASAKKMAMLVAEEFIPVV